MESEPNYSAMSVAELRDVVAHINPELVPERYARVVEELRKRGSEQEPALPPWWHRVSWLKLVAVSEMVGACIGVAVMFTVPFGLFSILIFLSSTVVGTAGILLWRSSAVGYFISVAAQIPQLIQIAAFGIVLAFQCGVSLPVGFSITDVGVQPFFRVEARYTLNAFWGPPQGFAFSLNLAAVASLFILWRHRQVAAV